MEIVLGLVVAVVVAVVAYAGVTRARFRRDNQVVPGVETAAPPSWAGDHRPEARLHRDLRDTIRALHRIPGIRDQWDQARRALEQEALAIDEHLVAVAALPERVRTEPFQRVEVAVRALETAVAELASRKPETAAADAVDDALERQRLLEEARAELDRLDVTASPSFPDGAPEPSGNREAEGPDGDEVPRRG